LILRSRIDAALAPELSVELSAALDADLAAGFAIGTTTVFRYIREALDALAPSPCEAVNLAARKA
jgi:hypothetical protein